MFTDGAMLGATFLLSTEAGIAKTDAMLCGLTTLSMAALGAGKVPGTLWLLLVLAALTAGTFIEGIALWIVGNT